MLCSRCSTPVRPVVAIDIDGTLGDYHSHFIKFAAGYLGTKDDALLPPYRGDWSFKDWFCQVFGVDRTTFRSVKLAYRQGGMKRTMPVFPGARALVWAADQAGAEIWITTTRPHDRFDRVDPDTREWLTRHSIPFDGLLFSQDKIKELSARVDHGRVVAVLDDLEENLREASEVFGAGVPILRRTRYNQAVNWPRSVLNLAEAKDVIQDAIDQWKVTNR